MEYEVLQKVGWIIGKLLFLGVDIFVKGIVRSCKQSKVTLAIYLSLIILAIVSYSSVGNCSFILSLILFVAIFLYIKVSIEEYPTKKKRKIFKQIFEEMRFYSSDKKVPIFMYDSELSQYTTQYAFRTTVPLNEWLAHKEEIAMHINLKIVEIMQDEKDNTVIYLVIETEPLPSFVEWTDEYINHRKSVLTVGQGYYGIVGIDLMKNPHVFIAGETGSGKSNILKCLIYQALVKDYDVELIDFKRGVSFSCFSDFVNISYTYETALNVIQAMVSETERRLDLFRQSKVDNIKGYNKSTNSKLKRKILFIDELAELLKTRDKEISKALYDGLETLTRLSRAVGIHLIMGIQRPDSTIVNGQIKNNVSYRLCGRFIDKEPSRIMLNNDMASELPNIKGRFIARDEELIEVQCFYYSDDYFRILDEERDNTIIEPEIKVANSPMESEFEIVNSPIETDVYETRNKKTREVKNEVEFDFND